jgi:hypothetical protein
VNLSDPIRLRRAHRLAFALTTLIHAFGAWFVASSLWRGDLDRAAAIGLALVAGTIAGLTIAVFGMLNALDHGIRRDRSAELLDAENEITVRRAVDRWLRG